MNHVSDGQFSHAVEVVSDFVMAQAEVLQDNVGFGWQLVDTASAPSTFDAVLDAYFICCEQQVAYPVPRMGPDTTLYSCPEVDAAFGYWRDLTHIRLHCPFSYWDTRAVGEFQLHTLEAFGIAAGSLPWLLLRADTLGQSEFHRLSGGQTVQDRRAFVLSAIEHGLGMALLHELGLQQHGHPSPPAPTGDAHLSLVAV